MTMRWVSTVALAAAALCPGLSVGCAHPPVDATEAAAPAYVAALAPKLDAMVKDTLAPAAAVMIRSEELGSWSHAWGTRTLGGTDPAQVTDHVRIGSNTKTMTGTVVLQLVEEGRLDLQDPISKFRRGIPNGDRITIQHLLEMRSGIPTYSNTIAINDAIDNEPGRVWQPDELVALALELPMSFEPGTAYEYSNTNTVLLGMVIEQITKQPVQVAFQERIFDRLGMHDTVMPVRTSAAIPGPHPQGYMFGTNVETIETQVFPIAKQEAAKAGTWRPWDATNGNPSWGWTAGAAISTAGDLATYAKALGGGGLLGPTMQEKRMASVRPRDAAHPDDAQYGLGIAKMGPMYGHTGELPGFNSFMGYDPVRKITLITWSSLGAAPDGRAPAVELAKVVMGELYAK